MTGDRTHKLVGLAIMAASLALFFWWGIHFHVFGTKIDFRGRPVATGGFFGWIILGMFGLGFAYGGVRSGLKIAGLFFALSAAAGLMGFLRGAYG